MATSPQKLAQQRSAAIKRRREVAQLRSMRFDVPYIAERLGVDQRTIYRDLEVIEEVWRRETALARQAIKAQELADLDYMEQELAVRWSKLSDKDKENPKVVRAYYQSRLQLKKLRADLLQLGEPLGIAVAEEQQAAAAQQQRGKKGLSRTPDIMAQMTRELIAAVKDTGLANLLEGSELAMLAMTEKDLAGTVLGDVVEGEDSTAALLDEDDTDEDGTSEDADD